MKKILMMMMILMNFSLYAQNCPIPKPTTWKNPNTNCTIFKGTYEIQFFSSVNGINRPINFKYYTKYDSCTKLTRYFVKTKEPLTFCKALDLLPAVRKYFPDAFPLKTYNRPLEGEISTNKAIQEDSIKPIVDKQETIVFKDQIEVINISYELRQQYTFWFNTSKYDHLTIEISYYPKTFEYYPGVVKITNKRTKQFIQVQLTALKKHLANIDYKRY